MKAGTDQSTTLGRSGMAGYYWGVLTLGRRGPASGAGGAAVLDALGPPAGRHDLDLHPAAAVGAVARRLQAERPLALRVAVGGRSPATGAICGHGDSLQRRGQRLH